MDFIGGLPKIKKGDTIFVFVDRMSKYNHFMALSHPYTAREVAAVFGREIVPLHGYPRSIVLDRDRVFISQFLSKLFKITGTTLKFSSTDHPQTEGQTEVVNRCLETYLSCFCARQPKTWSSWLAWAEYWFNTTFHGAASMTPFRAVYGRDPLTLLRLVGEASKVDEVNVQIQALNQILDE